MYQKDVRILIFHHAVTIEERLGIFLSTKIDKQRIWLVVLYFRSGNNVKQPDYLYIPNVRTLFSRYIKRELLFIFIRVFPLKILKNTMSGYLIMTLVQQKDESQSSILNLINRQSYRKVRLRRLLGIA